MQVRKPKRPARLAALPDLTTAAGFNTNPTSTAAGFNSHAALERLNACYEPSLQWPEFGCLLEKAAAAAAAGSGGRGGGRGRGGAAAEGGAGGAAGVLLRGAGGPVPAAVLDWGDAAAAEAAEQAAAMEGQLGDDLAGG